MVYRAQDVVKFARFDGGLALRLPVGDCGGVGVVEAVITVGFDVALPGDHRDLGHLDATIAGLVVDVKDGRAVVPDTEVVFGDVAHARSSQKRWMRAAASMRSSSEVA